MVRDKTDGAKDIYSMGRKEILLDLGTCTGSKVMPDFPAENHAGAPQGIIGCMEK